MIKYWHSNLKNNIMQLIDRVIVFDIYSYILSWLLNLKHTIGFSSYWVLALHLFPRLIDTLIRAFFLYFIYQVLFSHEITPRDTLHPKDAHALAWCGCIETKQTTCVNNYCRSSVAVQWSHRNYRLDRTNENRLLYLLTNFHYSLSWP